MLLNNILAGREYTTQVSEPHLKGPPQGYDSVRILLGVKPFERLTYLHK